MMSRTAVFGLSVAGLILSMVAVAAIADAFAGQTTRVSVSSSGEPANGNGLRSGGLSADGRYVVFTSMATNLGATGQQVYRRECTTRRCESGTTEVVSVTPGLAASSGFSPSVSADGRFVAFVSFSTDLVAGVEDTNGAPDVFLRDMTPPRSTRLVSGITTGGTARAVGGTLMSAPDAHVVSVDSYGTVHVAFVSASPDLAGGATNPQIYVWNMTTGEAVLASERGGVAGNGASSAPALSGDGRFVAFTSFATNLTEDLLPTGSRIYVRDLAAGGAITLESKTWDGRIINGGVSTTPALSSNGRYLAFESTIQLDDRVDHDTATYDVYLRDRGDGVSAPTTELVSRSDAPTTFPTLDSRSPSISADGNFVAFHSIDPLLVPGDTNGIRDVFLWDRTTKLLSRVSLNDDDVPANMPSSEPSLSMDGTLVLFASAATNLVADPVTTNLQLYLRDLGPSNVDPTVNLPSSLTLAFPTLSIPGTFTDPDANETYEARVDYGDGSGEEDLTLVDGSFQLHHVYGATPRTYEVVVTVTDSKGGVGSATLAVSVLGYTYEWLDPVGSTFIVGRNLPVKFTVHGPDGSLVADPSVQVDVIDESGRVVVEAYVFGGQPSRAVLWNGESYHVNVDTKDLAPAMYLLRVRFSSPTLTGEFTLGTTGTTDSSSSTRSRAR